MHTLDRKPWLIHYNADLSGDVVIEDHRGPTLESVRVPGSALLDLVAEYVRRKRVARLEDATTAELLHLTHSGGGPPAAAR